MACTFEHSETAAKSVNARQSHSNEAGLCICLHGYLRPTDHRCKQTQHQYIHCVFSLCIKDHDSLSLRLSFISVCFYSQKHIYLQSQKSHSFHRQERCYQKTNSFCIDQHFYNAPFEPVNNHAYPNVRRGSFGQVLPDGARSSTLDLRNHYWHHGQLRLRDCRIRVSSVQRSRWNIDSGMSYPDNPDISTATCVY